MKIQLKNYKTIMKLTSGVKTALGDEVENRLIELVQKDRKNLRN